MPRRIRFRLLLRHDGWGTAILKAVRPIAQQEIPAYAGMTWKLPHVLHELEEIPACAGMTETEIPACAGMTPTACLALLLPEEIPACAGMTWEGVGMTRPRRNDGESNLLRPGRNPCRKSRR